MHVMTMRLHDDQWAEISREARRLGISYAEFMRGAISFYLGHQAGVGARGELERRVNAAETRLGAVIAHLQRARRADAG